MDDDSSTVPPDDELTLPRAAVNKMIKELLPHIRVANSSRELILNCCTEFILLLSSQANEVCEKRNKKTILPEHVIESLTQLGFTGYVEEVEEVFSEYKTQASSRKKASTKLNKLGIPEEELLRQQQALFAAAREQHYQSELAQHHAALAAEAQQAGHIALPTPTNSTSIDADDDYD